MGDAEAEWWEGRAVDDDVIVEAAALSMLPLTNVKELEQVADCYVYGGFRAYASLSKELPPDNRPDPRVWEAVKREFHALCCTKDRKYQKLRAQLASKSHHANGVLIGLIAAGFQPELGVSGSAGVAALVAVALAGLLKLGREAMCTAYGPGALGPKPKP
jgi:hypothetical protein